MSYPFRICLSVVAFLVAQPCFAQRPVIFKLNSTPLGGGVQVVPGEVLDLFVRLEETPERFQSVLGQAPTDGVWTTTLSGVSVKARFARIAGQPAFDLPIGLVTGLPCRTLDCQGIIVRAQLPFEVKPVIDGASFFTGLPFLLFSVTIDGEESLPIEAVPASSRPRLVGQFVAPLHPDGRTVQNGHAAKPGEILTILVTGLGLESEDGRPGTPSPETSRPLDASGLRLAFDFSNPRLPLVPGSSMPLADRVAPLSVRFRPGEVGVYEVKFQMPPLPEGTQPCLAGANAIRPAENVRLTLTSVYSDSVLFCAAP